MVHLLSYSIQLIYIFKYQHVYSFSLQVIPSRGVNHLIDLRGRTSSHFSFCMQSAPTFALLCFDHLSNFALGRQTLDVYPKHLFPAIELKRKIADERCLELGSSPSRSNGRVRPRDHPGASLSSKFESVPIPFWSSFVHVKGETFNSSKECKLIFLRILYSLKLPQSPSLSLSLPLSFSLLHTHLHKHTFTYTFISFSASFLLFYSVGGFTHPGLTITSHPPNWPNPSHIPTVTHP